MPMTMSSNDAKQRWGSVLSYVTNENGEVIVESHGKPKAVVLSVAAYEEFQALREQRRHAEGLERLHQLQERIAASNAGSTETEEEQIEFAVTMGREINRAAAARSHLGVDRSRG